MLQCGICRASASRSSLWQVSRVRTPLAHLEPACCCSQTLQAWYAALAEQRTGVPWRARARDGRAIDRSYAHHLISMSTRHCRQQLLQRSQSVAARRLRGSGGYKHGSTGALASSIKEVRQEGRQARACGDAWIQGSQQEELCHNTHWLPFNHGVLCTQGTEPALCYKARHRGASQPAYRASSAAQLLRPSALVRGLRYHCASESA